MNKIKIAFLLFAVAFSQLTFSQDQKEPKTSEKINFIPNKSYTLGEISVTGTQQFSEKSVKVYSGLTTGQQIKIPGDKLSSAIKRLYGTKRFSTVDVFVTKIDGETIYLEFSVTELPQLSAIKITGVSNSKAKTLKSDAELKVGEMVTDNLLVTTKNYFKKKYTDKGYLNTKVSIDTKKDTAQVNAVKMKIHLDKGSKIKIDQIRFHGNERVSDKKLRKYLKNTKRKFWGRFWKFSKYIEEEYKEDLDNLIDKYSEQGFRDARIISDTITWNEDKKTINLDITLQEGKKYYFNDIKFLGNSSYTTAQLKSFLKIEKGDVYNSKILNERVKGDGSPDSEDISTLYQNNGYLFSQVNAVETKVDNDSITVEIRIHEDDPATIKKVSVSGNEVTNDHVVYRELRTKPGQLYSKENIIRSIREISQLGFFDPENVTPDLKPNYTDKTVDIDYSVVKKGSSQIELQGGYGGGAFIGTLGLSFNNFSIKNILKKEEYKPLPMGDGQSLALRLQASRYYSTYSFSFSEPWLGGKKPKSFSISIYNSKQYQVDYRTYSVDKSKRLNILGLTIGLGQRLQWPDDYFTLSQSISFRQYDINQYNIGLLNFENGTGTSNNLSYSITLGRNSSGPSRIFPTTGSEFTLGGKFTLPHSLFKNIDYGNLENNPEYYTEVYPNGDQTQEPIRTVNEGKINQEKFRWLEYYKLTYKAKWYTPLIGKSVLMTNTELGFLGAYNADLANIPFEKYFVGGDGLQQGQFDGREVVGLRGYENSILSGNSGGKIYNKYDIEIVIEKDFVKILSELGVENLNLPTFSKHEDLNNSFDLLFTLGGDGTILNAITLVRNLNIPILGINTGRLGFLATVQKKEIENAISSLINNEYTIQERALLEIHTNNKNADFKDLNFALNEVTIARKNSTSMIGIEAYLNDEPLTTYWSDGLVIATPTGSTGYSLSCHGPIIIPESNNFVLTPIAPHNLSARPLVIPDKTNIKLKVIGREKEFFLSLDSRVSTVEFETEITLKKASFQVKIIQLNQQTFIKTLRSKLFWGEDKRNYM